MPWGVEHARDGIRVVSVSAGAIDMPLVRASWDAQGGEAELANRHPLGRLRRPDEIAHAMLWLASAASSFIAATDMQVDGGLGRSVAFADLFPMAARSQGVESRNPRPATNPTPDRPSVLSAGTSSQNRGRRRSAPI